MTTETNTERMAQLHERVNQFLMLELPGQPKMMHVGTSSLVCDLDRTLLELERKLGAHDTARAQPASVADDLNEDAAWIRAFAIPSCERQTTRSGLEAIAKKLDLLTAPQPLAKESDR